MKYSYTGILYRNENKKLKLKATSWINVINIILSERSKTQKRIYSTISLKIFKHAKLNYTLIGSQDICYTWTGSNLKGSSVWHLGC